VISIPDSAAYALLAGVALIIVLLHLLKPRAQPLVVASALLWRRVLVARRQQPARWRWWLSLLLALGIGLSLAFALSAPKLAPGAGGQRLVLVLDNSPSMAARTRDGQTRWQHAVARARAVLETNSAAMLLDTMGYAPASGFVTREIAQAELARVPVASFGTPRLPAVPVSEYSALHLFTDGVALAQLPADATLHNVFEPADNVAITAFEAQPVLQDPTRVEALVQIYNASPASIHVRLLVRGGEHFSLAQDLKVAAGELVDATFDVSAFDGGVLGAAVAAAGDAFPLDDVAYTVVAPHTTRRVLLVSAGNARLADSLRALPGTQLSSVTPARYPAAGRFEVSVFDRFEPAVLPPAALLIGAHGGRSIGNPAIGGWDETHALTAGLAWSELRLLRASSVGQVAKALLWSASPSPQGLIVAARDGDSRAIRVGFALEDSNFAVQPGFPVFLGKALAWLTEPAPIIGHGLGPVEVPLDAAQVIDGTGRALPVTRTPGGTLFEAARPDVYTATARTGSVRVVANVLDPRLAQINRSVLAEADAAAAATPTLRRWFAETWRTLLALAAFLMLVEWAAFTRRLTA